MCSSWIVSFNFFYSLLLPVAITQAGAMQLPNNGTDGVQGLQALTMNNAGTGHGGATIVQYTQSPDGQQIFVPSSQVVVQGESRISQK